MTTAFVLTGGGSLGAVQVGMLQALAAHEVRPDLLVGTSAGALNAAWVAGRGLDDESLRGLGGVWAGLRRRDAFPPDLGAAIRGLTGRHRGLTSARGLQRLVAEHATFRHLEDAHIPVHIVAADVLTGLDVVLSHGSLVTAVLASAAVPGLLPPVLHGGRYLMDGGVARHTGVVQAVGLGADVVYVLPAGTGCALAAPPRSAVGMAVHALSLLVQRHLVEEVAEVVASRAAVVRVLPPLCPLRISAADFDHGAELVERARQASLAWLAAGGTERPRPQQFLELHDHGRAHPDEERPVA